MFKTMNSSLDWSLGSSKHSRRSGGGSSSTGKEVDFDLDRSSSKGNTNPYVRKYIKQMSRRVIDPIELQLDERRLQNALNEAGEHSIGVDAIAVWMLDEDNGQLVHPSGGWWRSRRMEAAGSGASDAKATALARLENSTRDDYVPPKSVSPGTDIAGILWAEARGRNNLSSGRRSSVVRAFGSTVSLKSLGEQPPTESQTATLATLNYQPIRWRDIRSISQDPDSAKGPRLKLMEEAGFTRAAGITFEYMHHRGMVIFLTTVLDEKDSRLMGITNGAYLYQAAQFIGATLSLAELRRATLAERYQLEDSRGYPTERSSKSDIEQGKSGSKATKEQERLEHPSTRCHIPHQVTAWLRKFKGGSMQIPPTLSWRQTGWTIFGSFVGLLVLSSLNEYYRLLSDDEYFLLIGPFGAMCTLMYGLSAAPASQPMNAVMGQAIAGAISLAFTYIPEEVLPVWLRTAIGPAFSIGAMVKLGVVHPPAGAHSVLYASGKYNFAFYGLVVLSTAISVLPATAINNMSRKRQYPTYWGLSWLQSVIVDFHGNAKHKMLREDSYVVKDLSNNPKTAPSSERDRPLDSSSRMNNNKMKPNHVVIHEEDDENSSHGDYMPSNESVHKVFGTFDGEITEADTAVVKDFAAEIDKSEATIVEETVAGPQ